MIEAIFTGDTKRYHRFEIVDEQCRGMLYIPKGEMPESMQISLLSKAHPSHAALNRKLQSQKGRE